MNKLIPYLETLITVLSDMKDEIRKASPAAANTDNGKELWINPVTDRPQRDWEVLEFINTDKHPAPRYKHNGLGMHGHCLAAVINGDMAIHRVRRLSDGVEFGVGDKVVNDTGGHGTITEFGIAESGKMRVFATCYSLSRELADVRKVTKKPLFTTADGVPAYEGQTIYWLCTYNFGQPPYTGQINEYPVTSATDACNFPAGFSTREAAENAYNKWLRSQRVLSLDDVLGWEDELPGIVELVKQRVK